MLESLGGLEMARCCREQDVESSALIHKAERHDFNNYPTQTIGQFEKDLNRAGNAEGQRRGGSVFRFA